jgi:hypothetical protein
MAHERPDLLNREGVELAANRLEGGCGQDWPPHAVLTKKSILKKSRSWPDLEA